MWMKQTQCATRAQVFASTQSRAEIEQHEGKVERTQDKVLFALMEIFC